MKSEQTGVCLDERKRTDLKTAAKIPGDERKKIFKAAKRILQKGGYEELSIKNICEEAGVSNGSFYHHFKTKDDLLSYYIEDQPQIEPNLLELPDSVQSSKRRYYPSVFELCKNTAVNLELSLCPVTMIRKNQALNADIRTERPYPIVTVRAYVEKGSAGRRRSIE